MLLDTLYSEIQTHGGKWLISCHYYSVGRKEMHQLSSTKLELLPPMLSALLGILPTAFSPFLVCLQTNRYSFSGYFGKMKNKWQHGRQTVILVLDTYVFTYTTHGTEDWKNIHAPKWDFFLCVFLCFLHFSTEDVLVLWTGKGLSLIPSVTSPPTPEVSESSHLLHCFYLEHQPSLLAL